MSTTLSPSGLKKPANPDTGVTFWDQLAAAIQTLNDHTHSGTDSSLLGTRQTISSGSWGSDLGGGSYRQLITLPGSFLYDNISIQIRDASGHVASPTIEKVSATTYYVYTNDNTLTWTAVYV